ncbi:Cell division control protein 25 [Leucoagaricus sp. SymC.cos]|nr:Cell division control protein 25 [Leucoagaricus sp. SymC.cos]
MRQSLHIRIDPSPYDSEVIISPDSASPSPESSRLSAGTARTTPTSSSSDQDEFSVLCMYDFRAADLDQLSFRKNEILLIVKRENTGWWAAMRKGGDKIGWIPQAFVNPLTEEMAESLANVREELRLYEYRAEQLYSAPVSRNDYIFDSEPDLEPVQARKPPARPGINKPTPPTPNEKDEVNAQDSSRFARSSSVRRRPIIDIIGHTSPEAFDIALRRPRTVDRAKKSLPSEDYSQPVLVLQASSVPRYMQPRFADQLDLDADGQVRRGTPPALIERLMTPSLENKHFQDVFLMTFRSFMSPDALFDALVEYYYLHEPEDLNVLELEDWLERVQGRTQRKVLEIFSDWLQAHRLLEQEPHIAGRLTDFLQSITSGPNNKVSKLIQERIKDLTFSIASPITVSPSSGPRKKKNNSKPQKGELLKIEAVDIAEQLTVILYDLYRKILPHECITYARSQKAPGVANLREFCASHNKVSFWVQVSILTIETMKKRAETVDYWIKVAEKCRALNNFASMSAIITALNSTVITRLPLTWAHVSKKSILDSLLRYNDPSGGFSAYRNLNNADGPCLPFIVMYLTDLAHIQDQYNDSEPQICFYKRKRFYEVISAILRHQKEPYVPLDDVAVFIRNQLQQDPPVDKWLWKKSEEVQQSELAHADIRRGLEKAGF